jgi:hypothetical protein
MWKSHSVRILDLEYGQRIAMRFINGKIYENISTDLIRFIQVRYSLFFSYKFCQVTKIKGFCKKKT